MKRVMVGIVAAAALAGAGAAAPAGAAPINAHTGSADVTCEGIGATTVTFNEQSRGATAFLPSGQVIVVKRASDTFNGTLAIEGGPTLALTDAVLFESGGAGKGYEGRLVACSSGPTAVDEVDTLDQEGANFLLAETGVDVSSFIGATVHISGTDVFMVELIIPGS
jgi:hypothetical protein